MGEEKEEVESVEKYKRGKEGNKKEEKEEGKVTCLPPQAFWPLCCGWGGNRKPVTG